VSGRSSNYREFYNLVLRIKMFFKEGLIARGTEIFIFTDDFVTLQCFFKGTSNSPLLFELVLRLRTPEMKGDLLIHLIWVAGTRMIEQGTDGLSRGDLSNGVMAGDTIVLHVPLNKDAFSRSAGLRDRLLEYPGPSWEVLTAEGWFNRGHQVGSFVWVPSPAVADAALEQLCESRHTRPGNAHMFVCPALMTARWRRQLRKVSDVMFSVPQGTSVWPQSMHEPVTVALICRLLHSRPWQVRDTPLVARLKESLPVVWSASLSRERSVLCKFWDATKKWDSLSGDVARKYYAQDPEDRFPVLQSSDLDDAVLGTDQLENDDPDRFRRARDGDHLMCPLQCDDCHFRNIQGRNPGDHHKDKTFMMCIRRANLDALWSRESATVKGNRGKFNKVMDLAEVLGLEDPYPERGPYPEEDSFGIKIACMLLMKSLKPGINGKTIQYETFRTFRSYFANFAHTVPGDAGYATISDN
jgi:hypothetical protein